MVKSRTVVKINLFTRNAVGYSTEIALLCSETKGLGYYNLSTRIGCGGLLAVG